jgi:hypothetical protein
MWKSAIGAAAILAIAGSSFVYAQQRFGFGGPDGPRWERGWHPSPDDMAAMADARIAALKAGLRLTPEQDKNWPAFEQAVRDIAKLHAERVAARQQLREERSDRDGREGDRAVNPFERLQRRADNMTQFSAALKRMADTGIPLYQSLDDSQKHRFIALARMLRPRPVMFGGMRGGDHGWFHHHRGDRDGWFDRYREDRRHERDGDRRGMNWEPHEL